MQAVLELVNIGLDSSKTEADGGGWTVHNLDSRTGEGTNQTDAASETCLVR